MEALLELGPLLRTWRGRLQPADIGSPFGFTSTRTPGLRREEVAWLAGVSPDYVKRLEQGRAHPTASVVHALARALRLSEAETATALRLAGHASDLRALMPRRITPSVRRLLDRFPDTPVAVFDAAWTRLDQNPMWTALTGDPRGRGERDDNLVWRIFLGDPGRVRHPEPDQYRASIVADLHRVHARYLNDSDLASMVSTLRQRSDEFERLWGTSALGEHGNERKTIDHPELGPIELDCDIVTVQGADLRMIIFTAEPGTAAAEQLQLLDVIGSEHVSTS
ncbi:helix-turn-helix transcriptional regulator [Myceligenerans pegani]|uniref:Helix-turn-helix domain-containing protein n=1 Tax=Myceligenerans pegani TaxID=2776917 RepID=A0ABR9N5W3_9MICO|nr:helix-turn-helix transcriptional regulator [Myceligenerans sp. TRM 65318]MBE1879048.1 helix-turn-helix domain-containing protein [Myceligenerans sp. TRM 65318]MBE3021319.1 helix-turn-helix domain-containing protein [Myceligenerans sp. TRM 65318]